MLTALHYAIHALVGAGIWRAAQTYDKRTRTAWLALTGLGFVRLHVDHHRSRV